MFVRRLNAAGVANVANIWAARNPNSVSSGSLFGGFAGLARLLIRKGHRTALKPKRPPKGRLEMSSRSNFTRTLVAAFAALLMSTIAVGSAVGPAQASIHPFLSETYA
jgi:hypothetical protein